MIYVAISGPFRGILYTPKSRSLSSSRSLWRVDIAPSIVLADSIRVYLQ